MSQRIAYAVNDQPVDADRFYELACDPGRHVVVEACAGAGKTWMLVSRILRAMLEGGAPESILAITFTRKAAGEMRERLEGWMREFAALPLSARVHELRIRGMGDVQAHEMAPALAALHDNWLQGARQPRISTIHGWFSGLVKGLPLDVLSTLGLPAQWQLLDDLDGCWPEVWAGFVRALHQHRDEWPYDMLMSHVVSEIGLSNLETWLNSALRQRVEIVLAQEAGTLLDSVPSAAHVFPELADYQDPALYLFEPGIREEFAQMAKALGQEKGKTAQKLANDIVDAYLQEDEQACFDGLKAAFMTSTNGLRVLKGVNHPWLEQSQSIILRLYQAQLQQRAHVQHRAMVWASHLLFEAYERFKQTQGVIDMSDLELAAARLHADPVLSGWVQERLDLQIRHLLIDEFQDTSPLQWQTLHQWISGYAGAGGSGQQGGLSLFLVGDPKQSIYSFRRADPRVFVSATRYITTELGGVRLSCDHTRRSSQAVVRAVNQVMGYLGHVGRYHGFRDHTTASDLPGDVLTLPDVVRDKAQEAAGVQGGAAATADHELWRDSLNEPLFAPREATVDAEALQCAQSIAGMLAERLPDGTPAWQPQDIFVLGRRRADLACVAQHLTTLGVPNVFPENTRLMDTSSARDLMAVLEAIVMPWHDMAVAHALKSPAFMATDALLMHLARWQQGHSGTWWDALKTMPLDLVLPADRACLEKARQLMPRWQALATQLPPHDLLQCVVDDSDWRLNLARVLSAADLPLALSCLDAVVSAALALKGGRDATPWRWWRELQALPASIPVEARHGVVQLLTVHGAKGLEARAVFLINCDPSKPNPQGYTLMVDWPADQAAPVSCAFVARQSELAPGLTWLKERQEHVNAVESCNALYVAMTRAKERLVLSRTVHKMQSSVDTWWDDLQACGVVDLQARWLPAGGPLSSGLAVAAVASQSLQVLPEGALLPARAVQETVLPSSLQAPDLAWQGEVVHRVLEWATAHPVSSRTPGRLRQWVQRARLQIEPSGHGADSVEEELLARVSRMLNHPSSASWLDPQQCEWAANEIDLAWNGQWLRLDRLVHKRDTDGLLTWWVIDFKWHEEPQRIEAYVQQMRRYCQAVQAIEPHARVKGAFINASGQWLPMN